MVLVLGPGWGGEAGSMDGSTALCHRPKDSQRVRHSTKGRAADQQTEAKAERMAGRTPFRLQKEHSLLAACQPQISEFREQSFMLPEAFCVWYLKAALGNTHKAAHSPGRFHLCSTSWHGTVLTTHS